MVAEFINNKKGSLVIILALTLALFFTMSTVYAASTRANIYPGKTSDTSSSITATKTSGQLTVTSGGPNYYVQGYAKKEISFWPDSTAASLTAYPGQNRATNFSATKGSPYYAQINAQSGGSGVYGEAIVSF